MTSPEQPPTDADDPPTKANAGAAVGAAVGEQALLERIRELEDTVGDLVGLVEDLAMPQPASDPAAGHPGAQGEPGEEDPWETYYDDVVEWVEERFAPGFARVVPGQLRWCSAWWDHAEAISRLECLWRTWEAARLEPVAGMATWYSTRLDHHLPILLSPTGPFAQCTPDRHTPIGALPLTPVPDHWRPTAEPADPAAEPADPAADPADPAADPADPAGDPVGTADPAAHHGAAPPPGLRPYPRPVMED